MMDKVRELQEMIDALVIAIPRERAAHAFYMDLVKRATSETSRGMFLYLAEQEKLHEAKLTAMLAELKADLELARLKEKK